MTPQEHYAAAEDCLERIKTHGAQSIHWKALYEEAHIHALLAIVPVGDYVLDPRSVARIKQKGTALVDDEEQQLA